LIYLVWKHIDFDSMSQSRLMNIWNEFLGKVKMAATSSDPAQFLEVLCKRMGIVSLKQTSIIPLLEPEVLQEIRENTRLIVLMTRGIVEEGKKQYKLKKEAAASREMFEKLEKESATLFDSIREEEEE